LGLSVFSIAFDLLFIVQHYVLYPQTKTAEDTSNEYKRIFDEESGNALLNNEFMHTTATSTEGVGAAWSSLLNQGGEALPDEDPFPGAERLSSSGEDAWVTATSIQ
jgi:hypothetical protein